MRYEDGVYIAYSRLRRCRLLHTDQDLNDYYVPNGGFNDQAHEAISYISGATISVPSRDYLVPATRLPESITQGRESLDIASGGNSLTNIPPIQPDYVERDELQKSLKVELLTSDIHPIVTLDGRGGIGKTSLALHVISEIMRAEDCVYEYVLWFSARDIDLIPEGAKTVRPAGVTVEDFAKQYAKLLELPESDTRKFDATKVFTKALSNVSVRPTLFVFDNFETVVNPAELFRLLDAHTRLPNKVLITTRIRNDFRADLSIRVKGMSDAECEALIRKTAERIHLQSALPQSFIDAIIQESQGHPYVVKVLLGEKKRSPGVLSVQRVLASRDDILDALFERTYSALSPAAQRVFLTLAVWKSVIPELAVEAVLIRPGNELIDVREAIAELVDSSLVDEIAADTGEYFLTVPLAAHLFGKKKLNTSPIRGSIADDVKLLHQFGVAQPHDIGKGLEARLSILFGNIARHVAAGERTIEECLPVIEVVAQKIPKAWLYLADLCDERMSNPTEYVRSCLTRYLERDGSDDTHAWLRLADSYAQSNLVTEQINALVCLTRAKAVTTFEVSNSVNRVNGILRSATALLNSLDRQELLRELAETFAKRAHLCTATDLSRLSWLYISLHDFENAKVAAQRGIEHDRDNLHCRNLCSKLGIALPN